MSRVKPRRPCLEEKRLKQVPLDLQALSSAHEDPRFCYILDKEVKLIKKMTCWSWAMVVHSFNPNTQKV
ncbi:ferritin light chain 1-like protein [Cricetulus griseus]|nr:ferritin light chain 1-like protein [Cricetulus griseus]